jgi:hypothetical protein
MPGCAEAREGRYRESLFKYAIFNNDSCTVLTHPGLGPLDTGMFAGTRGRGIDVGESELILSQGPPRSAQHAL